MRVTRSLFDSVLQTLQAQTVLSLDTETTGLRPWNGDRLFSIIIGYGLEGEEECHTLYFNFQPYANLPDDDVLTPSHRDQLQEIFDDVDKTWFLHHAKYDQAILFQDDLQLRGTIHCTQVQARVERNDHFQYSLDHCLKRDLKMAKDDRVKAYIKEHKLFTIVPRPGRKEPDTRLHFDQVPLEVIEPYAAHDALGTLKLGLFQGDSIRAQCEGWGGENTLVAIERMERRLAKVIFEMERIGVLIDRPYCERAIRHEEDQIEKAKAEFKRITGATFKASPKLFKEIFASEKERWVYTEKNNPSFASEVLQAFTHEGARAVLALRDAESRFRFYTSFLYHADDHGVVHPNFNSGGTDTGRFSSSGPNFQNLTSEEGDEEKEFLVRRALIPRPGFVFIMPDYDQVEYKLMLDVARDATIADWDRKGVLWVEELFEVSKLVKEGHDVHQATADLVGVTRTQAKSLNFGLLYGMGILKLSDSLGLGFDEAKALRARYFRKLPEVNEFIRIVNQVVTERQWVTNWAGRKYNFPGGEGAFRAPNKIIQGGAADILKYAMCAIFDRSWQRDWKSRMVLTIHDELPCEIHESELASVPSQIQALMEQAYPHKYIPMTVGMEWSDKSLADKKKGFPV